MAVNPVAIVGRFFGRFFGSTIGEAAAYGIGGAMQEPIKPLLQQLSNETWTIATAAKVSKPPDPYFLAEGVAQRQVLENDARMWAAQGGIGDEQFTALVNIANTGPAIGQAYRAWRRGELTPEQMQTAIKRQGIEDAWVPALLALKQEPLDPSTIANAVHRGIMRDPSLIVREPPTTAGKVEQVPPSTIDPATEAEWSGLNHERLRVEVGTTGLPPGLIQMLDLMNRGVVTTDDVQRAVSQSNLRNEYMDVVLALARQLLSPVQYVDAHLRGYISPKEMYDGTALHGMTPADTDILFKSHGRPITTHQIVTGEARGGTYNGPTGAIPAAFLAALKESSVKPPYYNLAYANRYTYPSAFVLRALAEAGDLGDTTAVENILLDIGWPPFLAAKVAPRWAPKGAAANPVTKSEQTRLRTATHKSYVAQESDDATATAALAAAGIDAATITEVLALWQHERSLIRAQLSPADVRKAYQQADTNAATGTAWTRDEAFTALLDRGWGANDANDYLNIPYKG